jgi:hypothetical protein
MDEARQPPESVDGLSQTASAPSLRE